MKKILIPALVLGVVSVAGFAAFADTGGIPMSSRAVPKAAIITALETNSYASLPDAMKAKITEEQFQAIRTKYLSMTAKKAAHKLGKDLKEKKGEKGEKMKGMGAMHSEAVKKALEAGDYIAFREAMIAQIPTEAEFQKRVAAHKAHMVAITAMQTAIKNNDFAAFQKALEDMRTSMSEFHEENDVTPKTPDEAEMKKHFDEMVAQYKTDGTLPDELGKGGMKKGEGMRKGNK